MKYVHTIINSPFTNPLIDLVNRNFNPTDHKFFIIRGLSTEVSRVTEAKNVLLISNIKNVHNGFRLLWNIIISKKVFIHGLFTPYLVTILYLQPWILKKCSWVIWGGDLYLYNEERLTVRSKIIECLRARVIRNMGRIITSNKGDYALAKKWYNVNGKRESAYYPFSVKIGNIDNILKEGPIQQQSINNPINIVIGNSAYDTNKHFEILNFLRKFQNENIKIYAILAYGDKEYAKEVRKQGESIFGDKFICLNEYLPFEDFVHLINQMDILIFNHERQQGLGNLLLAIYLKKKIFINDKSPLWSFFKDDLDLIIGKTNNIEMECFSDFISVDKMIIEKNRKVVAALLLEENVVEQWGNLFN